ncbi:MAG: hypothetical protein HYX24_04930 [Candidatus Aenigmarchaeota archaeon]|nr:hypothetical protein [Candidatus Aenigmarchaeota archaeon]
MKYTIVAPVGDNIGALFVSIKEFPTERIVLISAQDRMADAEKAIDDLKKFSIDSEVIRIEGNVWEELFRVVGQLSKAGRENIVVNVATGDRNMQCAATSAAFVNGLKAVSVENNEIMPLPVLRFNYYKILSGRKMKILEILLSQPDCCSSLEQLSQLAGMSLPLISYHINGTPKSDGLKTMGLAEAEEKKGRVSLRLTALGRLLLKGYVGQETGKQNQPA